MPEEDDDALGEMLAGRLKRDSDNDQQESESDDPLGADVNEADDDTGGQSDGTVSSDGSGKPATADTSSPKRQSTEAGTEATRGTGATQSTQSTQQTETAHNTETTTDEDSSAQSEPPASETVRSRSPLPLYVNPELKAAVQTRYEKFNAQRTLNDEPQVQKHKHFMEGLLAAGLDHPDLERYVLKKFEEE